MVDYAIFELEGLKTYQFIILFKLFTIILINTFIKDHKLPQKAADKKQTNSQASLIN